MPKVTSPPDAYLDDQTPVQKVGDVWLKRDDLFMVAGASGGKARTCWKLSQGATGLVTAGSRHSPQIHIVACVAQRLKVPCHAHTPTGELSYPLQEAKKAGAVIQQHKAGYNTVIIERARAEAKRNGWTEIPFGMECVDAVNETAGQCRNIPSEVKRIVVPVGSGMSLAGIAKGLQQRVASRPVVGVVVGANPRKRLARWLPFGVTGFIRLENSTYDYEEHFPDPVFRGVALDPVYEAKCIPFLKAGDMLWVVGIRPHA